MKVALATVSCLLAPTLWAAPPTDLTTDSICRDRLTARWTNAAGVVSNALEVIKVFPNAFEADYATNYTFSAFTNTREKVANSNMIADELPTAEPGFSGQVVYAAANSVGVLQIGSTGNKGCLTFEGLASYEGLTLLVNAQRYVKSGVGRIMPIDWVVGDVTNALGTIKLGDQMEIHCFPLDEVEDNARILFHSSTNNVDGRVLIDSIGFVRSYTLPYTQTNAVHAAAFPARDSYRVRGLEPLTRYCWRVRGDAADDWSEYVTCETTNAAPPPLTIRIR